ncbi:protein LIFEGUARD 4-like isoform X3 [Rhododendron vialii]|uniref:protein LIFEGUARD 4-like isoform X3 n=1 Tax=Rhododendron vialii TaxID=182163 RepID=UPI00265DB2EC|nr:protein LIFEGUARD 4-like isoform X3 [Rhododendron vialii]
MGRVVLLAGTLTSIVVISSTLYTFWAAKNGWDFHFMGPFLFTSLLVLIAVALIQGTDNLIKRFNYNEYIWAAISLYLDIINLFLALLHR